MLTAEEKASFDILAAAMHGALIATRGCDHPKYGEPECVKLAARVANGLEDDAALDERLLDDSSR